MNFWPRTKPPLHYTAEAESLFKRISDRHNLTYSVDLDAPIEVMWRFPIQEKLVWPIELGLQNNDELNFGAPGFWSYFFPFPSAAKNFERYIDAWVLGEARIVRHPGWFVFTSRSDLEILSEGKWTTVYRAYGDRWEHSDLEIRNSRHWR